MPIAPLTSPTVPASARPPASRGRRRRWAVVASVLLHALTLALLLVGRRPEPPMPVTPSYDLVFENGGSSTPPTAPDQALEQPSEPPDADRPPSPEPPVPSPLLPEPPSAPPVVEALPEPLPPEITLPPEPVPLPVPEAAPDAVPQVLPPPEAALDALPDPEAAPLPETAPAPTPAPPTVRLAEPDAMPPALSPEILAPDLPALVPPPPVPPPPVPRPRQQAQQRPAPGAFPPPIDLNYGPATARPPTPRVAGSSRAIDLSLGAPKTGPNKSEAFFDVRAANIGADWAQGLAAYWRRHRYYPPQAAENGEDGTVQIQIVVNRQGRVVSAEIQRRSGSAWLDMAAVGTWRNAQLAPLPDENTDRTITIPLTINYLLIRR